MSFKRLAILRSKTSGPALVLFSLLIITVFQLHHQGRMWWCACGRPFLWEGSIWSAHTSQHLFDPYSFTHILHGVAFCGLAWLTLRRIRPAWQLCVAVGIECAWEIAENSTVIIDRYREATIGLGYTGDSIANSLSDIACCTTGFLLARALGFRRSVAFFIVTEMVLLFWIRDNLTLNVLMLLCPVNAIKVWQMAGH
jgi:hypothetical protein